MINKIKGFTLIELLIVITIIGILSAVAIPTYTTYTRKAMLTEAFSILDGISVGIYAKLTEGQECTTGSRVKIEGLTTRYIKEVRLSKTYEAR